MHLVIRLTITCSVGALAIELLRIPLYGDAIFEEACLLGTACGVLVVNAAIFQPDNCKNKVDLRMYIKNADGERGGGEEINRRCDADMLGPVYTPDKLRI